MNWKKWALGFLLLACFCHSRVWAVTFNYSAGAIPKDPPQRVVVLTWESTEQLLELGIAPIAVADRDDYKIWVVHPDIPSGTVNAGSRSEPNLGLLAKLKPDLMVISSSLASQRAALNRIAPTLLIDAYTTEQDNPAAARVIFQKLAQFFHREQEATQKLALLDSQFGQWRQQLAIHFGHDLPPICLVRFNSPTVVNIFGDNSMPYDVLHTLGLKTGCPVPSRETPWGAVQRSTLELSQLQHGLLFYFAPFKQSGRLFSSPLWRSFPLVKARHVYALPSIWTYGGEFSRYYIGAALMQTLLNIAPEHSGS